MEKLSHEPNSSTLCSRVGCSLKPESAEQWVISAKYESTYNRKVKSVVEPMMLVRTGP